MERPVWQIEAEAARAMLRADAQRAQDARAAHERTGLCRGMLVFGGYCTRRPALRGYCTQHAKTHG